MEAVVPVPLPRNPGQVDGSAAGIVGHIGGRNYGEKNRRTVRGSSSGGDVSSQPAAVVSPPSSRVAPLRVMGGPSPEVVRAKTLKT